MMQYVRVVFEQLPKILFAHSYESAHYKYLLPKVDDILELLFVEQGQVDVYRDGRLIRTIPEKSLHILRNYETLELRSNAPLHRHITVGLAMRFEMIPISEGQVVSCSREIQEGKFAAILPLDQGFDLEYSTKIPDLIREIIHSNSVDTVDNELMAVSRVMRLLAEITKECVRKSLITKQLSPAGILYTEKAMQYISEHIREQIATEDIADFVKVSSRYLRKIFKEVTGQTLTEYINRSKMMMVKNLVLNGRMTYKQAGEYVGISDSGYLSRLFRQYMGVSIREMMNGKSIISE